MSRLRASKSLDLQSVEAEAVSIIVLYRNTFIPADDEACQWINATVAADPALFGQVSSSIVHTSQSTSVRMSGFARSYSRLVRRNPWGGGHQSRVKGTALDEDSIVAQEDLNLGE